MSTSSCAAAISTATGGNDEKSGQCLQSYHQHLINISEGKEPDIVFLGDHTTAFLSITQVWDILFAQSHSLNLSAVEDRTQDLLWRLENSLLDKVTPKGLLPCCQQESPLRALVSETNQLLHATTDRLDDCQLIDVSSIFVKEDGSISHTDMFDFFHLTKYGYYKAFEPVHDLASQILQEAYGIKFTKSTDRLCDMDGAV
ncbi:platelet-activating factor acetylhydrolase IB subunit beta-like [Tropilaelaps mercedesae]|uniref:Platelet-activating factor acetylhydrolase IB subunit beta-like n=1 Tax=Tropilaelaps mercedesae TaxID=418985 RepID=A0A1V9XHE1_9ACAR|nr:platelet-activating factor acetylhydrolase IB subunit beta-like [Tropilaelaps mercedesae]